MYLSKLMVIVWLVAFHTAECKITIIVNHATINALSTRNFKLTCMYEDESRKVMSVKLAKLVSIIDGEDERRDLVSMDSYSDISELSFSPGAKYTGQVEDHGKAFLAITWQRVPNDLGGLYKCIVSSMDKNGNTDDFSRMATVHEEKTTFASAVTAIEDLQTYQEEIQKSQKEVQKIQYQLQTRKDWMTLAFNLGRVISLTSFSEDYENQHYFMAINYWPGSVTKAEVICQDRGGYLAELNDFKEWTFVASFLQTLKSKQMTLYSVSGRWSGSGKTFFFPRLGKGGVAYMNWVQNQPDDPKENPCVCLSHIKQWKAVTGPCEFPASNLGFICEMPNV